MFVGTPTLWDECTRWKRDCNFKKFFRSTLCTRHVWCIVPWCFQGYFQRILSMRSTSVATTLSIASMFGCMILAFPSALIGVVARATDWSLIEGFNMSLLVNDGSSALPMVLRYLTPQWVSFVGESNLQSSTILSLIRNSIVRRTDEVGRCDSKIKVFVHTWNKNRALLTNRSIFTSTDK